MKKKISVVTSCYKVEQSIPQLYNRLKNTLSKIGVEYELIFVNDDSPDNTETILCELANKDKNVIVINLARNFYQQAALTSGIDIATGDALVLIDADLQDPPELIEEFYQKWQDGFEVVYGVRDKGEAPFLLRFAIHVFYLVWRKLAYINIPLHGGEFSLIDRKVIEVLKQFPERSRFMRGLRAWVGFRQAAVGYFRPKRMFGRSTYTLRAYLDWAIGCIFSFSYVPLQLIFVLALFLFIVSLLAIAALIALKFLMPDISWGFPAVATLILFIGSIQLLGISVIGQYIGVIFEEVKQRPKYIVRSIIRKGSISK